MARVRETKNGRCQTRAFLFMMISDIKESFYFRHYNFSFFFFCSHSFAASISSCCRFIRHSRLLINYEPCYADLVSKQAHKRKKKSEENTENEKVEK